MTQTPLYEFRHDGGFMVSEENGTRSRDIGTIVQQTALLYAGTVLGKIASALAAAAVALGTNTGNGTFGAIAVNSTPTETGNWSVVFTSATAFNVLRPDGSLDGTGTTGVQYAGADIKFTITAGGTAFVANDSFTLAVTAGPNNPTTVVTPGGSNTGNGTVGTVTTSAAASAGEYVVEFDSATNYVVSNPAGLEVGHGTTGTAFAAGGLGFTITAGGTAFAAGDSFAVIVAAGAGTYTPCKGTAGDGSQNAVAILWGRTDATQGAVRATIIARAAEINASELLWDPSMTAAAQAAALLQLTAVGIIPR